MKKKSNAGTFHSILALAMRDRERATVFKAPPAPSLRLALKMLTRIKYVVLKVFADEKSKLNHWRSQERSKRRAAQCLSSVLNQRY